MRPFELQPLICERSFQDHEKQQKNAMRKNSGDRGFSAAVQHRRVHASLGPYDVVHDTLVVDADCCVVCCCWTQASGDFDNMRAEKLHANLRHGRSPAKLSKRQQKCTVYDTKSKVGTKSGFMSAMSFVSVLVTLTGSLFLISYAVVSTAIANANSQ